MSDGIPTPEQMAEANKKFQIDGVAGTPKKPQDHKPPKLTKQEEAMWAMHQKIERLEQTLMGVHRMLTSVIAVGMENRMVDLIKTMRNDMRIGSTLASITQTEKDIIAEEAAKVEVKK